MNENKNWFLELWENRCEKWEEGTYKITQATKKKLLDAVGLPPAEFHLSLFDRLSSHLRSNEEYLTQILCWLLNNPRYIKFKEKFLKLADLKGYAPSFEFVAEVKDSELPGKGNRYDIVVYEVKNAVKSIASIIECKVGADFEFTQLKRYQNKLADPNSHLITITRFHHEPEYGEVQIYWHQIFKLLQKENLICDSVVRESVKELFQKFLLDIEEFSKVPPQAIRQTIVKEIQKLLLPYGEQYQVKENWTTHPNGFFNFILFSSDAMPINGTNQQVLCALPSLNIMVNGYYVQGCKTDKENTHGYLIKITAKIFSRCKCGNDLDATPHPLFQPIDDEIIDSPAIEKISMELLNEDWHVSLDNPPKSKSMEKSISYPSLDNRNDLGRFWEDVETFVSECESDFSRVLTKIKSL